VTSLMILRRNGQIVRPGSVQEKQAAEAIETAFLDLGYEPEVQAFTYIGASSEVISSQNVIVRIPGTGFTVSDEKVRPQRCVKPLSSGLITMFLLLLSKQKLRA
jgi:hypothetical protein